MKVVIDATPAELAETLNLLKNGEKKNAVTEADDICSVIAGKLDQVTRAMEQPTMGVGQPTIAGGEEYGK